MAAVAVCLAELDHVAHEFPLAFLPLPKGRLRLVGVLGAPGANLFVGPDGHWLGRYVPAVIRAYPFAWRRAPAGRATLYIDEASPLLSEQVGAPLFTSHGSLGEATARAAELVARLAQDIDATEAASSLLLHHGVLEPWTLPPLGQGTPAQGFLRVAEPRLRNLGPEALHGLLQAGSLPLAYAQILSTPLLARLVEAAARRRAPSATTPFDQSAADLRDLEFVF